MHVKTQPFKEAIELKSDGICFDIYGNGAKRLGDLAVTKSGLVWSKVPNGKLSRAQGINVRWEEFINWVQTRKAAAKPGIVKLSAPKGKQSKPAAKSAVKHVAHKLASKTAPASKTASKSAHGLKIAAKRAPALKSASVTFPALKTAAKRAPSVKLASKTSAAVKLAPKPLSPARKPLSPVRPAALRSTVAKQPAAKLVQSRAKGKTPATAAKKPATRKAPAAARSRKAS